ncbi:MAG: hypothetical protein GX851_01620, partial [Clostridiales bacterium]|nr:hypothetical protein [Clostridiales bacterium]
QQGSSEGIETTVSLDFLDSGREYTCELFTDIPSEPENMQKKEFSVSCDTVLNIKMSSGGGFVMRLVPQN